MRQYEEISTFTRDGFLIIVDKTYEDLSPRDCFDDTVSDIEQICRDIDSYKLDWFMLRVRVMLSGHELGSHYLGGCLYEDAKQVLTDGTVEDCLIEAMHEAKLEARRLLGSLQKVIDGQTV
jgi:hypothetical protein